MPIGGARSLEAQVELHERLTRDSGVSPNERSRFEHEVLSQVHCHLIVCDWLNIVNLAGAELAGRRLQLLGALVLDGGAAVWKEPTTSWVSRLRGVVHRESATLKERRKAHEAKSKGVVAAVWRVRDTELWADATEPWERKS